jgi:PAS domain S-box-containing protein
MLSGLSPWRYRRGARLGALLAGVLLAVASAVDAQDIQPSWQVVGAWREPQGLPQSSVFAIHQTQDGYIWVGTKAGLARFDGVRFTTYDDRDPSQLLENEVRALNEAADGSLWITTYGGGVSRLKNGRFRVYTKADGLISDLVRSTCSDNAGSVWIGTNAGLSRFVNDGFVSYTKRDGLPSYSAHVVFCDDDGGVWTATGSELAVFRKGQFSRRPLPQAPAGMEIRSLTRTGDGALWVATSNGLYRLDQQGTHRLTTANGLSSNAIRSMAEDQAGRLWLATDGGLDVYTLADGTVRNVSSLVATAVAADVEGSIWVGSLRDGLSRLLPEQFIRYTAADGLADDVVNTVVEGRSGNVWIGTAKGLNRLHHGRVTALGRESGLPREPIGSVLEDRRGHLWVGSASGLHRSQAPVNCSSACHVRFTHLPAASVPRTLVRVLFEATDGTIWIGSTTDGLVRFQDGVFRTFTTKDGLADDALVSMAQDHDGSLWIGTRGGLTHLVGEQFSTLTRRDGLANDSVHALYIDADNVLWIGTRQGMHRLKNGRLSAFTVSDGLFANFVHSFVEDGNGALWMTCSKGVFSVSKKQLNDFADGHATSVTSAIYGVEHGLVGTVTASGYQPSASRSADGRIWFAIDGGVSAVDPTLVVRNRVAPPVHIDEVLVDNEVSLARGAINAPPGTGNLVFHYAGLSFLAPEKVRFRYRLEGHDREWVDAGSRRAAYYNNIRPGSYTFRVVAANNHGVWNAVGDSVTVTLAPYFYQTYWFYALAIAAVACVTIGAHAFRVRHMRLREEALERLVAHRTAELQDQKTFLRKVIDLNPSYIFTRDREGRYTMANKSMADAHGVEVDDLIGKTELHLRRLSPKQVDAIRASDEMVFEAKTELFVTEVEAELRDGTRHWVQLTKIPLLAANGEATQLLAVATDITKQKVAAIEMQRAKEAAEAATRAKSSFLANMSHELRTPMNAVIGMTDLLLDTELSPEQRDYVATVRTGGDSLLAVINDILDFSKIESGTLTLEQAPFDIVECLESALDLVSARAAEKRLELACRVDPSTPGQIAGDIGRVRQVLVNLLTNAVKFTQRGEVVVVVSSAPAADGRAELHIAIRDTGPGIPHDKLGLLFQSFSQIDASATRQHGGTGLGLAISKRLAEMMDGRVWVESQEGVGSTFHFSFPGTPISDGQPAAAGSRFAGRRALVVDDNDTSREILIAQLADLGIAVEAVASGEEALTLADQHAHYDCVAVDLHMPAMDGVSLARALRRHARASRWPLVLLTPGTGVSREVRSEGLDTLFVTVLSKPVKRGHLLATLDGLCGGAKPASRKGDTPLETGMSARLPLRILLAEDNHVNQKVARIMLGRLGYDADVAVNGIEVIEAMKRRTYDVVLMDVQMPEMDGLEASRMICRLWDRDSRPRIIAMTANAMQGDREDCLAAGMHGYLSKPVQISDLQAMLEDAGQFLLVKS